MLKRLFSHSMIYAVGPQVPKLVNILVLPIITQFLTPLDYGVYGTLLAYTGLLQGVKNLGFDVLLVNSFFKKTKWKDYWDRYLGGLYVYNIFFALVYIAVLTFLIPQEAAENKNILIPLIVIPAIVFDTTKMFGGKYFQLSQKPKYIAIVSAFVGVVSVLLNLYTIAYLKLGYLGWFITIAVGSALNFCCYAYPLYFKLKLKPKITLNRNFWKKNFKVALPTIPHNYSSYLLNSSDRLVMDRLKTPIDQIGIYNMAYIFGGYLEIFGDAVGKAVAPYYGSLFSKKNTESDIHAKTLTFFLQVSFIVLCSTIALWSKQIFQLLISNHDLETAYSISIFIIMGYSYRPMYWASANKLMFYEKTSKLWRVSFIAGTLNVALNIIFIPIYGVQAAAITTFGCLMYLGFSFYFLKDYKTLKNQKYYPLLWLTIIVACTIIVYLLKDSAVVVKALLSAFVLLGYSMYFMKNKMKLNQISI